VVTGEVAERHVWRAVSADWSQVTVEHAGAYGGWFGLDIELSLPPDATFTAAAAVKGCVDGVIASYQRFPEPLGDAHRAMIRKRVSSVEVERSTREEAPVRLVSRKRLELVLGERRAPLGPGPASWSPADAGKSKTGEGLGVGHRVASLRALLRRSRIALSGGIFLPRSGDDLVPMTEAP
jgi:hypothetical protein